MFLPLVASIFVCFFQLSSIHQILASQLGDAMMYPLNKFLQADLDGKLADLHGTVSNLGFTLDGKLTYLDFNLE